MWSIIALFFMCFLLAGCEKPEKPVVLPEKSAASLVRLDMSGGNQIFFDLESGHEVKVSSFGSWDLAFEAHGTGYHVFMNGASGRDVWVYNTHLTDPVLVHEGHQHLVQAWQFDAPCGLPDSTGVGDWRTTSGSSKNEVYIVKRYDEIYKKIVFVSVDAERYVVAYGDLAADIMDTVFIPKSESYSHVYFSFDKGGTVVQPEPPKTDWDVVFTSYRHIFYDLNNAPYPVIGVLLNAFNTTVRMDSVTVFDDVAYDASIPASAYTNHRDGIGFFWKNYVRPENRYEVYHHKVYIINTSKGSQWKLHFLDYYNDQGERGYPLFEYERIR